MMDYQHLPDLGDWSLRTSLAKSGVTWMWMKRSKYLPGVRIFRGTLRQDAERTFDSLKQEVGPEIVPLLQPDAGGRTSIVLCRSPWSKQPWSATFGRGCTLAAVRSHIPNDTFAGAAHQGVNLLREPQRFSVGLPYSLALLAILGCHELGHYFMARHHRMRVTPPFFIPVPFALGTFGAFIQMRRRPRAEKHCST
jgi:hypothetical protein